MPFTIFHLGPPFLLASLVYLFNPRPQYWKRNIIPWLSIICGAVIPDLQGFMSIFFDSSLPLHGFSHTIVGAFTYSIIFSSVITFMYISFARMDTELTLSIYGNQIDRKIIFRIFGQAAFWCTISILFFHLLPDMIMHSDIEIFWPISDFTLVDPEYSEIHGEYRTTNLTKLRLVTDFFIFAGFIGAVFFFFKFWSIQRLNYLK